MIKAIKELSYITILLFNLSSIYEEMFITKNIIPQNCEDSRELLKIKAKYLREKDSKIFSLQAIADILGSSKTTIQKNCERGLIMSENNLPIKLVLPKTTDIVPNIGGGDLKFFGKVTPELKKGITDKFEELLSFYSDVFDENEAIPAVGKITVKPEAIAKSHKPSDLCRNCRIIGSEDLDEIYIKVDRKNIHKTIEMVENPPSQKFQANMTAIVNIQPIKPEEKISPTLQSIKSEDFNSISKLIKIKIFDFDDDFDNEQIWEYVIQKLHLLNFEDKYEIFSYGDKIKFLKIEVTSYKDIIKLASINGVKTVDFFQEYSLPQNNFSSTELQILLDSEYRDSDVTIGIIDGGISDNNPFFITSYCCTRRICR